MIGRRKIPVKSHRCTSIWSLMIGTALSFLLSAAVTLPAQQAVPPDTLFKGFSVDELVKLRRLLAKQRQALLRMQERSREKGLEISKDFIGKTKEESANQDKILIRIAEYYVEEAQRELDEAVAAYEKAYAEYEKLYEAYQAGKIKKEPEEPRQPRPDYQKAIAIYDILIKNFPESDLVDDAYYNKAYLLSEMGEDQAAQQTWQALIDKFPESEFAPEAYMKLAESYFYPQPSDTKEQIKQKLHKAIQLYKNVLRYKDTPRYDEALYKLGWSYYRLAADEPDRYTDAILYFLAVVKDVERAKAAGLEKNRDVVRADVEPEALEYMAASFVDPNYRKSGVANAQEFILRLGKPDYGLKILEHMGDRYAKITMWDNAVLAYQTLLDLYPDYAYAPSIQKKIADAYLAAAQPEKAFQERLKLFETYNPKTEWYASMEQRDIPDRIDVLDNAYRLSEEALRVTMYSILSQAKAREQSEDTTGVKELYRQVVDLARRYIDNFPTDDHAYDINWTLALVLDTKLGRFRDAFEEYLRVSNDYLETEHQYDAAINAIAVADTLVKMAGLRPDTTAAGASTISELPPSELSPEEQMLAEAYDNFIKWFPEAPETPGILASAGALYYNHRLFATAKKYYKTMVARFPNARERSIGLLSLMNSYFFMGQYKDAEIVARKIVARKDSLPAEQVEVAQRKIAEAIFKNAEKLEQQGKYLDAAREYFRVYQDAKGYAKFIDLALLKAARNYERVEEWQKAINTYQVLVQEYPDSKYALPALGNIAEDYKVLEDYASAAHWNEEIFHRFPGTKEAEDALYNASYFYEKAEQWPEVIRVNNLFIATYPDNPESKNLFFDNAKYYLKLGNLAKANQIYQEFANLYPDDPRTVEAFYQRGKYYFEHDKLDSAQVEFNRAIQKSNELAAKGMDPNLYFASEAYYQLGEILFKKFQAVELTYPPEVLRARLNEKSRLLKQVVDAFTRVVELGSVRSFPAMFRIAQAYEVLADAIAFQKLPPNMTSEQRLVEQDRVFKASVPAYDRAVEEYKSVLINLPQLAEKLGVSLSDTARITQPTPAASSDTTGVVQKVVEKDSTLEVALKWYKKTRQRISSILFTVAERSENFITAYLRSPNPFPEGDIRNLAYRARVLRELVAPSVQTTLNAHLKNLTVSRELGLKNRYVIESSRKLILVSNILADEYGKLFWSAKDVYQKTIPVLEDLIERGETATTPDNMNYYDVQDNLIMVAIRFMDEFAGTAEQQYKNTLDLAAQYQIQNDARFTTEEKLFNFAFEAGKTMLDLKAAAEQKSEAYANKYAQTDNPSHDLASVFFDDQAVELGNNAEAILANAYDIAKAKQIDNIWTKQILSVLIELQPDKYVPELPMEKVTLASDTTWRVTTAYEPGWNQLAYSDTAWQSAVAIVLPVDMSFPVFDSLGVNPSAIWVGELLPSTIQEGVGPGSLKLNDVRSDTLAAISDTSVTMSAVDTSAADTAQAPVVAFFRKPWYLRSTPINAELAITADQSFRLFINEQYIVGRDQVDYQEVTRVPFEAIREILKSGDNIIACRVEDSNRPHYGLRFYLEVALKPSQLEDIKQQIARSMQINVDPHKLDRMVTLNRNRIVH